MWDGDKFVSKGKIVELDPTFEVKIHQVVENRPIVAASLGPVLLGAAAPKVNPGDTKTSVLGAAFRVGRKVPTNKYKLYRKEFNSFVGRRLRRNFNPLAADTDISFYTWIENAPYPRWRKDELIACWEEMKFCWKRAGLENDPSIYKKWFALKSFIKDESYVGFKHSRTINSRSDQAKCLFGPVVQAISNHIMKTSPHFIKYVPVHKRPEYIMDYIDKMAQHFDSCDFTSFEAHFTKERMLDCELQMFKYMLSELPDGEIIYKFIAYAKAINPNMCFFKHFQMKIEAKRMSGEMDTSLSNGFSNLMWIQFSFYKHGLDPDLIPIVIEGDDSLFVTPFKIPTKWFDEFGLDLKVEEHTNVEHASFCGLVFDSKDKAIVTDIFDTVANLGWTTANYSNSSQKTMMAILRCKSLSMAYQYKGCPILSKLALKMLLLTTGVDTTKVLANRRFVDAYYYEIMKQAFEYIEENSLDEPVGMNTRNLVEQLYGITIADQLAIEDRIDKITDPTQPLILPELMKYAPRDYLTYFEKYSVMRQTKDQNGKDLLFCKVQAMRVDFN